MEQVLKNNTLETECESCSTKFGKIRFNHKARLYLCDFCSEESDSLLPKRIRKTKMRDQDS